MNTFKSTVFCAALALSSGVAAQNAASNPPPALTQAAPQVDYAGFMGLTAEVAEYRQARLIQREAFFAKAAEDGGLILDTRSAAAFDAGHINGAINLPFSDFTDEKLAKVLGKDTSRAILIYCNNNFSDNAAPIMLKAAPLALNIPTFINLYGYGYKNVWELDGVMTTQDVDWIANPDSPLALRPAPAPLKQ
ncbi:MAG: rhodanese-like domain-containing protein [Marinomonas sp.]